MIKRYDVNIKFIAFVSVPMYAAEFIEEVCKVIDIPSKDIKYVPLLDGSVAVSTINKSVLVEPGNVLMYYPDCGRISTMRSKDFDEYHENLLNNYEV